MCHSVDSESNMFSANNQKLPSPFSIVGGVSKRIDHETRSRITGGCAQMKVFNFYFKLCLGQKLYALTDNLSKSIKEEIMPAVTGQRIAALTLKAIERMRNEADFNLLFKTLRKKASDLDLKDATFPRKRKTLNYSRLHLLDGHLISGRCILPILNRRIFPGHLLPSQ